MADAAEIACQTEVQADGLGVAHVKIAVGLWRKAGADLGFVDLAALVMLGIAGRAPQ